MVEKRFAETIETEHLILRSYRTDDAPDLLNLVERNRQELIREFAQVAGLQTREQVEAFIGKKSSRREQRESFCYGIWRIGTKHPLGQLQVKNVAWEIPAAELSYFIDKKSQRQGYAKESLHAILARAFDELRFERIFLRILPSNVESFVLATKLGFQQEGLHRNAFRCGFGQLHDVRYLSLTRGDYRSPSK